jgi:hypothetical protein
LLMDLHLRSSTLENLLISKPKHLDPRESLMMSPRDTLTQDRLNSTIGPREKKYTVAPTYTTTHRNKNVNGR